MIKSDKRTKTLWIIAIIAMVFLSVFSVVYAYFTAEAKESGSTNFANYNVALRYKYSGSSTVTTVGSTQLELLPASSLSRGGTFQLKNSSSQTIEKFSVYNSGDSLAYVRFWVDAYLYNNGTEDRSVNYGKYFHLCVTIGSNIVSLRNTSNSSVTAVYSFTTNDDLVTYFLKAKVQTGAETTLFTSMMMDADAPTSLFGQNIVLYFSYQSVQADNQAFQQVFNDEHGYALNWS